MKNINTYIVEKLHLNKDIKLEGIDKDDFIELLDECGEITLDNFMSDHPDVEWPWTKKGHSIDSIYIVGGKIIATYVDSYTKREHEEEVDFEDFSEAQIKVIYEYMLCFRK